MRILDLSFYRKIVASINPERTRLLAIENRLIHLLKTIMEVIHKFLNDNCMMYAASLSYTTLVTLAPFTAVMLSIVSSFDLSREATLNFILTYLLPNQNMAATIESNLNSFATNASAISAFGVFVLFLFVIWGLNTIEGSFNMIWQVSKSRSPLNKFFAFWSSLTFAPAFLAVSIVVSAKLQIAVASGAFEDFGYLQALLFAWLPFIMIFLAFMVVYRLLPNTYVEFKPAIIGSIIAATLFDYAKDLFNYFVSQYGSYEAIYGALYILPMFLLWIYISWVILLIGAVITYAIQNPLDIGDIESDFSSDNKYNPYYILRILMEAGIKFKNGNGSISFSYLIQHLKINEVKLRKLTDILAKNNFIEFVAANEKKIILSTDPENIKIDQILLELNFNKFAIPNYREDSPSKVIKTIYSSIESVVNEKLAELTLAKMIDFYKKMEKTE